MGIRPHKNENVFKRNYKRIGERMCLHVYGMDSGLYE